MNITLCDPVHYYFQVVAAHKIRILAHYSRIALYFDKFITLSRFIYRRNSFNYMRAFYSTNKTAIKHGKLFNRRALHRQNK